MSSTTDLMAASISGTKPTLSTSEVTGPTDTTRGPDLGSLFARRDFLIGAYKDWKDRIHRITLIANGYWYEVWPDLTREPSAPSVANTIELALDHFGAIMGTVVPSVKVPVPHEEAGPQGERGASKRERRIRELRESSNYAALLGNAGQDYAGTGAAALGVWVNFEEPDPAKRNPYYLRFDPRHYYPVTDSRGNITEFLVARKRNLYDIAREYPDAASLSKKQDVEVEEWFWYTNEDFLHCVVDVPSSDPSKKERNYVVLSYADNELGLVPVVEIHRPTFDGERRGEYDQTIHIMRMEHMLMMLTVERTAQEVFPAIAGIDVDGLEKFGPGATMEYLSPEGKIDVFNPQHFFDVKDLIARLDESARVAAKYPQQLSGEPGASIASSRAIQASMGALDSALAQAHRQFEWGLAKLDSLALMLDEKYCDGQKTIYGDARDRKNPETFLPSRDIAGHYEVVVSYGIGAGSDAANREMRITMAHGDHLISRKRAREELDWLEDPEEEETQVAKEALLDAVLQGFVAKSAQGDSRLAMEFFALLNDADLTLEEKFKRLIEKEQAIQEQAMKAQQGPQPAIGAGPPGGLPGGGAQAAINAEGMARGGVPGQAASVKLPPLAGILGGGPNQVA